MSKHLPRKLMRNFANALTVVCLLVVASARSEAQSSCRPANFESDAFLGVMKAMMDSDMVEFRSSYSIPLVTPAEISFVSDSTVCANAGVAMDALGLAIDSTSRAPSAISLFVFQIGTSYAVVDLLSHNTNDADFIHIFSSSWVYKGTAFIQ
jgi:hypothetical protein